MFLQTDMTSRRKFLERSMLGFGGAFLLPSLLASCTDHTIPPSNPPITPPPLLGDDNIDWNDDAKAVVVAGLGLIPEVGEILGPLVDLFWPSTKEDVWGEIKAQVEALVDQKIGDFEYGQVTDDLQGLNNAMTLYLNEVKNGTPSEILNEWQDTRVAFVTALPHFQSQGYELPLLPLFGQFANLYLSLLRDGVAFGKSWGRTDGDVQQDITDLKKNISDFTTYTANTYQTGLRNVANKTKVDPHQCEPFRSINTYDRQMRLTVLDFMNTWPYFDVTIYPNGLPDGVNGVGNREIFSDPLGTCDDSGNVVLPQPPPTQLPTNISVWYGDRIQSVQVTYPAGSGPGGATQTKRGAGGGTMVPITPSPDNRIKWARATYGSIVNSMQFIYQDNQTTAWLGGEAGSNDTTWGYYDELLSSVHINGISNFYGSADCVVFGFQYYQSLDSTLNAIRALYVKSPKERSLADFTKAFKKLAIPSDLINDKLKADRQAYWASFKARLPK